MTVIGNRTKQRIARAVREVEQRFVPFGFQQPGQPNFGPMGWLGFVKDAKIANGASGDVYLAEGSSIAPTESTTVREVANPYCGDVLDGQRVFVLPMTIEDVTSPIPWYIAPFPQVYEGKADTGITSGSSKSCQIWRAGSDTTQDVTVYLRWVDNSEDISAGKKIRMAWDYLEQRWYVESKECE